MVEKYKERLLNADNYGSGKVKYNAILDEAREMESCFVRGTHGASGLEHSDWKHANR
jgi:hypothetical protein